MQNWHQVMGTSKLLWFLPLKIYLGSPQGNGVDWNEPLLEEKKPTLTTENPYNAGSNYSSKYSVNNPKYKANIMSNNSIDNNNMMSNQKSNVIINIQPSISMSSLYKNTNVI